MIKCVIIYPNGNLKTESFKTLKSIKSLLDSDLEEHETEYWNIKFKGYTKSFKEDEDKALMYSPMGSCLFNKDIFGTLVIPYITPVKLHFLQEVHTSLFDNVDSNAVLELLQEKVGRIVYKQTRDTNLPILRKEDGRYILPLEIVEDLDKDKIFINREFLNSRLGKFYFFKGYSLVTFIVGLWAYCSITNTNNILLSILGSICGFFLLSDVFIRLTAKKTDKIYQRMMSELLEGSEVNIGGLK